MNIRDKKLSTFDFVTIFGLFGVIFSIAVPVPLRAATPQQSHDTVDAAGKAGIVLDQKPAVPTLSEQGLTELLTTAASRRRTAARSVARLDRQTRCLAPQEGYPIPFALDVINVVIKTVLEVDPRSQGGQIDKQDIASTVEQESARSTYWEGVSRDLPFDWDTSLSDVALVRYHQHVANAAASAEKVLECQLRAAAAIDQGDGEMAVAHLETGLYLSWRGRHELRQARKHWNLAISQLDDWADRFETQTSGADRTLEQQFAEWQANTRRDGLADGHVAALRKAGCLPHEIDRHKVRLLGYDVRETARLYSRFRSLLPALKETYLGKPLSDRNFLQDRIWTRLCYIWASLREKYEQTGLAFQWKELRGGEEKRYAGWCVLPAGAPASELLRRPVLPMPKARSLLNVADQKENDAEARSGPLVPGHYDVYLIIKKSARKQPLPVAVRLAKNVTVRLGQTAKVSSFDLQVQTLERLPSKSGVRIETSDGLSLPDRWFLVEHGADWTTTVGQPYGDAKDRMLVAPGKYDVYLAESQRPPLLFARAVTVKKNHWTVIEISSALRLEMAKFLPSVNYHYGCWGVVSAGGNPNDMLHWSKSPGTLVLPLGTYDVYWKQGYSHKPLLLAADVRTEDGKISTVNVNSGLQLETADWVPGVDYHYGRWGVVPAGGNPGEMMHWSKSPSTLVLPPGTYDVYRKQGYSHKPTLLTAHVRVGQGELATIRVNSGIRLEVTNRIPGFGYNGHWGVVPAGEQADPLFQWSSSPGHLPLAPGRYDVYWKQDYWHEPQLVESGVTVKRETVETIRMDHRP